MEQQHQFGSLNIWDLLITPIYLFVILALATRYRDRKYPKDHPYHKLYMQGLYLKMAGAIFIGLIYSFYYAGGDTFAYHFHATVINSADSIPTWFKLMWRVSPDSDPKLYEYTTQMLWYREAATFTVARIAAVFGLFNGTHYLPTAILFAYFSFTGVWAMYTTFSRLYPNIAKKLAVAFLFIPSVVVWGSSIFKDTICLFSLGWMTYSLFRMFIQRDFSLKNVGILALCIYLLAVIKIYILIAIMPALMLWLLLTYSKKIRSVGMRWAINLGSVAALSAVFLFSMTYFSAQLDEYSLDKIIAKSQKTQSYLQYMSALQEGSGYNLGDYAPTPA
ncbi:MAG: hypothetical protein JWP27_440, partial [Flaviaesturariibacter sp.]|nr:hypothetical protein [Flaviaesturariibacter sp.]